MIIVNKTNIVKYKVTKFVILVMMLLRIDLRIAKPMKRPYPITIRGRRSGLPDQTQHQPPGGRTAWMGLLRHDHGPLNRQSAAAPAIPTRRCRAPGHEPIRRSISMKDTDVPAQSLMPLRHRFQLCRQPTFPPVPILLGKSIATAPRTIRASVTTASLVLSPQETAGDTSLPR